MPLGGRGVSYERHRHHPFSAEKSYLSTQPKVEKLENILLDLAAFEDHSTQRVSGNKNNNKPN